MFVVVVVFKFTDQENNHKLIENRTAFSSNWKWVLEDTFCASSNFSYRSRSLTAYQTTKVLCCSGKLSQRVVLSCVATIAR